MDVPDLLSNEEWKRRSEIEYAEEYTEVEDGERFPPHECPVCGFEALVEMGRDSYDGDVPYGTCIACSYTKSYEVADLEGRDRKIDRMVDDGRS